MFRNSSRLQVRQFHIFAVKRPVHRSSVVSSKRQGSVLHHANHILDGAANTHSTANASKDSSEFEALHLRDRHKVDAPPRCPIVCGRCQIGSEQRQDIRKRNVPIHCQASMAVLCRNPITSVGTATSTVFDTVRLRLSTDCRSRL